MIIILGANGYLGSNLLQLFLKLKFRQLLLVDPSYHETQKSERINETTIQYFRSIKELESDFFDDQENLTKLKRTKKLTIINVAGYSRRGQFDGDLQDVSTKFSTNVLLALDLVCLLGLLFKKVGEIPVKLIQVSTAGAQFDVSPTLYEFSKFCQEQVLGSWWNGLKEPRCRLIFVKLNDVFGGVNDVHDKIINRLKAKRQFGESLPYINKSAVVRPISVEFVCNSILKLSDAPNGDESIIQNYLLRPKNYFKIKELDQFLNLPSPTKLHTQILNFKSRLRAYFFRFFKEQLTNRNVYKQLLLSTVRRDKELFENFDFLNFYYQSISKLDNRDEVIYGE